MDKTEQYVKDINHTIELLLERAHNHVELGDIQVVIDCIEIIARLRRVI